MTIRTTLLGLGAILWAAAAGCWWRARGSWRLSREGWLFLLLGMPFFVAGWFFTSTSYPEEGSSPPSTPIAPAVVLTTPPPTGPTPPLHRAQPEPQTYAEAVIAAQHAAVARYPDLGKRGTPFNLSFVTAYRHLQIDQPGFFTDPEWPMHLADRIARTAPVPP